MLEYLSRKEANIGLIFAFVISILVIVALLKPYVHWRRTRSLISRVSGDLDPSEATITLMFLRMKVYESFYETAVNREGVEEFLRGVVEGIKEALRADAWSVILTHEDGKWYFAAWDDFYDKKDLDKIIPHIQESGGARQVFEKKAVLDIPNTLKRRFWRDITELVEKRGSRVFETRSWIGIPVVSEDRVVSVISIDWFKPRAYKKWMVDVLKVLSSDISRAFQAIREVSDIMLFEDYDPISGLPGEKALTRDLEKLRSSGVGFSIVVVKMANIRKVWQLYGQSVRGKVMKSVARKLKRSLEGRPRMYSKSGDEIVVILETVSHQFLVSVQRKILGEFLRVFRVDTDEKPVFVRLSVRIGYAIYPEDTDEVQKLFEVAKTREISN